MAPPAKATALPATPVAGADAVQVREHPADTATEPGTQAAVRSEPAQSAAPHAPASGELPVAAAAMVKETDATTPSASGT